MTDSYRSGADGKIKTDQTIRTLYALLEDLLFLKSGTSEFVRNTDIEPQLEKWRNKSISRGSSTRPPVWVNWRVECAEIYSVRCRSMRLRLHWNARVIWHESSVTGLIVLAVALC